MTRPRTRTIPGYRIQPMLPIMAPFGGACVDADFTEYDGKPCVEALVRLGLIEQPYTIVLSYAQALDADIIERDPATKPCGCPVCNGRADDPANIHGRQ